MRKFAARASSAVLGTLVSGFAFAAPGAAVDVTDVVGTITNQLAPIGLVGVAVLGIAVAIKGYKWIRRAL